MTYTTLLVIFIVVIILILVVAILLYFGNKHAGLFLNLHHDRKWLPNIGAPFLSDSEVVQLREKIAKLRVRWVNSTLGTIGTASYIDSGETHRVTASGTNRVLTNAFPGLHQKLLHHLNERYRDDLIGDRKREVHHTGGVAGTAHAGSGDTTDTDDSRDAPNNELAKWVYPPKKYGIALPGIHVFAGDTLLGRGWAVASVHVDKQEERCPLPESEQFDFTRTYSFTIPLVLPRGTGLYIIEAKEEELPRWKPLWWSLRGKTMQKIDYRQGECYLHHGKYFHCIAPFYAEKRNGEYENRITIQGHAVYCSSRNEYWVYW